MTGTGSGFSGPFLGDTKGNSNMNHNLSSGSWGSKGEGHSGGPSSKFIGPTKGNKDLPNNRTSGMQEGMAGKYIAGRNGKPY